MVRPFIFVLAGVNGAGKSSVGGSLLTANGLDWFNPDTFARELSRNAGIDLAQANAKAWAHGKSLLKAAMANGTNYAFETTLGGNTICRLLMEAGRTHSVVMWFCGLATPELHIARVAQRVNQGGHPIAEEKILERWQSSRLNLIKLLPYLTGLQVFDNSAHVEQGQPIANVELVLDVQQGRVTKPDPENAAALSNTPLWARPIVEAALLRQHP